jgi:pimeloyl-ACP methyl ester carboxylesterase
VHGDRDPFYPLRIALEMFESIPRSCLWIVPGGGHGPIFGDVRGCFAQTASAFLRDEWRGGAPG